MDIKNRRQFLKLLAASGLASTGFNPLSALAMSSKASAHVVIIGGGFGGATCAKYLNMFDPSLSITVIEPSKQFVTCPFSNMVLSGLQKIDSISHGYQAHIKRGINVVHDVVRQIDAEKKQLTLSASKTLNYDKLVVSPGIDFKWDEVDGMTAADAEQIPHAWKAGTQTTILQKQLAGMRNGGTFLIAPPPNPFRCPPGPYERISMVANYLKQHKPKSKVLVLDAKNKFSKQPLFTQGWEKLYPGMIEWVAADKGGRVDHIDVKNRTLHTELGDAHKADVINFIPPQKAGSIAQRAGLVNDDGWCPVNQRNFKADGQADIHVIGDASIAGKMPKSGFAANSQGKVCAAAIVSELRGKQMPEPSYVNTCYSLVSPDYGISVAAVYRYSKEKGIYKVKGSGGVSPKDADADYRKHEARYAKGWYDSITFDSFG